MLSAQKRTGLLSIWWSLAVDESVMPSNAESLENLRHGLYFSLGRTIGPLHVD
jgi:hypothetical protein